MLCTLPLFCVLGCNVWSAFTNTMWSIHYASDTVWYCHVVFFSENAQCRFFCNIFIFLCVVLCTSIWLCLVCVHNSLSVCGIVDRCFFWHRTSCSCRKIPGLISCITLCLFIFFVLVVCFWMVQMGWHPAGLSMHLPLLSSPCLIKSRLMIDSHNTFQVWVGEFLF